MLALEFRDFSVVVGEGIADETEPVSQLWTAQRGSEVHYPIPLQEAHSACQDQYLRQRCLPLVCMISASGLVEATCPGKAALSRHVWTRIAGSGSVGVLKSESEIVAPRFGRQAGFFSPLIGHP